MSPQRPICQHRWLDKYVENKGCCSGKRILSLGRGRNRTGGVPLESTTAVWNEERSAAERKLWKMCLQRAQLLPRCHPSSQLQFSIVIIYFWLRDCVIVVTMVTEVRVLRRHRRWRTVVCCWSWVNNWIEGLVTSYRLWLHSEFQWFSALEKKYRL